MPRDGEEYQMISWLTIMTFHLFLFFFATEDPSTTNYSSEFHQQIPHVIKKNQNKQN
jgi:hypothetical protein